MATVETALELFEQIQKGERSAVTLFEESLDVIRKTDDALGAFNTLTESYGRQTAETVDAMVKRGETLPLLAGVPVAVKDNINIQGYPTTCSSHILTGYQAPYHATTIERLGQHLLPVVGKTNLDEFAMGSSTENSAFKPARNPWNTDCVPGGSSGGSAVAVASTQVPLSLGSDTGGSVRQPAALCGIVGLKPTYGLVSRYGLVAFASSLDQISPFARTVEDAAAILQVIQGFDPKDSTSMEAPSVNYLEALRCPAANPEKPLSGLRVGVIQELQGEGMAPDVVASFEKSVATLKELGATVSIISLPSVQYAISAYYIIATAEASSNLARFDGVRYGLRVSEKEAPDITQLYKKSRAKGFGPEVKRRIMLGTFCLSSGYYDAYYGKAQKARHLLRNEFDAAWKQVDVLVCPTSPTTAFKLGEKAADPVSMYLSDIATIPVNLVGIPAISVPCGFDHQKLPIGLQILGPHLSEARLLGVAHAYEAVSGYRNLLPQTAVTA